MNNQLFFFNFKGWNISVLEVFTTIGPHQLYVEDEWIMAFDCKSFNNKENYPSFPQSIIGLFADDWKEFEKIFTDLCNSYWYSPLNVPGDFIKLIYQRYSFHVALWLISQLEASIEKAKTECGGDNYRIANINKAEEIRQYNLDRDDGCCGFFDENFKCAIDGNTYTIGFNYDH